MKSEVDIYSSVTQKQLEKKNKSKDFPESVKNEKKSKKVVHDLFVQGTNDSSIVSKRSVEILYADKVDENPKHFFQYFVKKSPRRTPVINRGYWIRMKSIRMAIDKIVKQQPHGQRINIINLGCGYDPLPFQLLDDEKNYDVKLFCIDVDFPELIGYKSQMIRMAPELTSLIGEEYDQKTNAPGVTIRTDRYATMGCDLTDKKLYIQQLDSFMANDTATTNIFVAEVSLAYMTPTTANPIIETSSMFNNSHFLILEQLMPSGENHPFAKRMINHFKKMEAPLQCVHTYPTIEDQISRFKSLGYNEVNARDLLGCWELVPPKLRIRVEQVEAFDEWEEFIFFGQHYINLHATNQRGVEVYPFQYKPLYQNLSVTNSKYYFEIHQEVPHIQRKFHSCFELGEAKFLTSGTNQARLADTVSLMSCVHPVHTPSTFKARVSAASITVNNRAFLIGGRRVPGMGIDEVWEFLQNGERYEWRQRNPMNEGRVKHTVTQYEDGVLVYGGSDGNQFSWYDIKSDEWIALDGHSEFHGLESAKLINCNNDIFLLGGKYHICDSESRFEFNSTVYRVEIDLRCRSFRLESVMKHETLARYGFCVFWTGSQVLLIGGVGKKLYNQNDTIVELDLKKRTVRSVPLDDKTWEQNPIIIGSDVVSVDKQAWLVCGGAVCYGFGSVWGKIMGIGIGAEPTKRLEV